MLEKHISFVCDTLIINFSFMNRDDFRPLVKHVNLEGRNALEIKENLRSVYGDSAPPTLQLLDGYETSSLLRVPSSGIKAELSATMVNRILTDRLGMKKMDARWLPKILSATEKAR